ncbi:Peptidoglycan-associated lipoprotein [bacterium HR37]|nr:Peptidoglycan-associated lipoprotein [bacterium HR37]
MKRDKLLVVFPVVFVFALLYLVSCATPPPTKELADAEAAVAEAKAAGCPECAPEECAAAESALAKGKALAGEFCAELEARRLLVDAKAKADEAKFKCMAAKETPPPPPPAVEEYALSDIFFDFDKFDIRPDAEPVLQQNAEILKANPDLRIVIEGYADIRGPAAYNLRLAQRRADAAKAYLVRLGIDPARIEAVGKGETTKFAAGTTEEAYQLNRRAHFIPLKPGAAPGARIILKLDKENKS